MNELTEQQLLNQVQNAYLPLIHLDEGVEVATTIIVKLAPLTPDQLIRNLIATGASWRERLIGLVLATQRGIAAFADAMIVSLNDPRGISIVPTCAALAVAVKHFGYKYSPDRTSALDRSLFDGELGYALDCLHAYLGLSKSSSQDKGPNYGQEFSQHVCFYERLCGV
ncbi:MAG: hypothetical protein HS116_28165 [Planctomycetes bacterium]|nr:hypothetical protein [Planctomycetota bacterium]